MKLNSNTTSGQTKPKPTATWIYKDVESLERALAGPEPEGANRAQAHGTALQIFTLRGTNPKVALGLEKEISGTAPTIAAEQKAAHSKSTGWQGAIEALGTFFTKIGEANTWIRVAEVVGGALLILFGLITIAKDELPGASVKL